MKTTHMRIVATVLATALATTLTGCAVSTSDSGSDSSAAPKPPATDTDPGSPSGSPADSSDHDPCVVGTWNVSTTTSLWETVAFADDGSYESHLRASTATVTITETGEWLTSDGVVTNLKPAYWVNQQKVSAEDLAKDLGYEYLTSGALKYTCGVNSLVLTEPTSGMQVHMSR